MNTMHDVLRKLYSAAKDNMSAGELREVGGLLTEIAESHAIDMRDVVDGIACLVVSDVDSESGAGSFQQADGVFTLLVTIGRQFDLLAGMLTVGSEATWRAEELAREAGSGVDHE